MSNIYQAIVNIMADVEAIGKNKRNDQQKFNFRGIDDVYNAIHPLMAKHGVFSVPYVEEERTEDRQTRNGGSLIYRIMKIRYTFYAADGSSVEARVIGEGMDSGDKAANKAMAVGHKYALLQVLAIPTEDMVDPDSESPNMKDSNLGQRNDRTRYESPTGNNAPVGPEGFQDDPIEEPKGMKRFIGIIPEEAFHYKDGYAHLVQKADGDENFVKQTLKNMGITSSAHITFNAYKQALAFVTLPQAGGIPA